MKHELQIHTKAVNAQMSDFYEVCSLIVALLIPVEPKTSDTQLSLLSYRLTFIIISSIYSHCKSFSDYCDESSRSIYFPSTNSPENVLETNNGPETEDSSWNPYFAGKYFIMDMGCPHTFEYILVKNTHNHENRDTSSKKLR